MKHIFLFLLVFFASFHAFASNKIVATYPPIQSLVWSVTDGVTPVNSMFIKRQLDHHNVQLKPSQMKMLKGADIVFYASDDLETFMKDALKNVAPKAKAVSLEKEVAGLNLLPSTMNENGIDAHFWLDVDNALLIVDKVAEIMIEFDPKNEKKYRENLEKSKAYINKLKDYIKPDETKKFVAFHEGFEYMAKSLNLNIETLNIDVENINTPQAFKNVTQKINDSKADCFLIEPHTSNQQIKSLGLKDKGVERMDAFGWNIDSGVGQYYNMMRWNIDRLNRCRAKK